MALLTSRQIDSMRAEDSRLRARRDDAALRDLGIIGTASLASRKFNPAEPRDPHSGKWSKGGAAIGALLDSLKKTGATGGVYFEDGGYLDWSSRKSNGAFALEIGDGSSDALQIDATMDDLRAWQQSLTRSLVENDDDVTGFGDPDDESNQADMSWVPQDEHGERWDVTATDAAGDEVTFDWPRSHLEKLHTVLTTTLLAEAMGGTQ